MRTTRDQDKKAILDLLGDGGGFTTGDIASRVNPDYGSNTRQQSAYIRSVLLEMLDEGLVQEMDDEKPVVWIRAKAKDAPTPVALPTPVAESPPALPPSRQQLSCASKEILEQAVLTELNRLRSLRSELIALQVNAEAVARLDARIDDTQLAFRQLGYVYIDQFEEGRAENDRAGRLGLTR